VHLAAGVTKPWSAFPQLDTGQCTQQGGAGWLQVHRILPPTQDFRPFVTDDRPLWGFHHDDETSRSAT
jgi:hypothetical protein